MVGAQLRPAAALDPSIPLHHYLHLSWPASETFPTPLRRPVQTQEGYLWFGTSGGLVRFDGHEFRLYDGSNTPALRQNLIWGLLAGRDGSLWINPLGSGFVRWRQGRFERMGGAELAAVAAHNFMEDRRSAIWVSTQRHGLLRVPPDGSAVSRIPGPESVGSIAEGPEGEIWGEVLEGVARWRDGEVEVFGADRGAPENIEHLFVDRDGTPWVTGPGKLCALRGGRFECQPMRSSAVVSEFLEDREGRLWLATDQGLSILEEGRLRDFTAEDGISESSIHDLLVDRDGNLWAAGWDGLFRWNGDRFEGLGNEAGLVRLDSLLEDREGTLWVSSHEALHAFQDPRLTVWGRADGLAGPEVLSVVESAPGEIWIGTREGLHRLHGARIERFGLESGLPHLSVHVVWPDGEGGVWVGTQRGLCRLRAGRCAPFEDQSELPGPSIYALFVDRSGALWIGTSDGLARWKHGALDVWTTANGLASNLIRAVYEDPGGRVWVGTDGGLHAWDGTAWRVFTQRDGLQSVVFRTLTGDGRGGIWLGTLGGGLQSWREGRVLAFGERSGLPSTSIFRILEDAAGFLWVSTDKGIARLGIAELESVAAGRLERAQPLLLGRADGMASSDCSTASQPAGWRDHRGHLWFTTARGLVEMDPEGIEPSALAPAVVFEGVTVDQREVERGAPLTVPPGASRVEFRYTAPTFRAAERVRFRYRLKGFDRDWVEAGRERQAVYTNLRPGRFTFSVLAANGDGIWAARSADIAVRVEPRFFETAWFYALCALAAAAALFGLHRFRTAQLRARFAAVLDERGRIAREVHDSLAQGLTAVSLQLEGAEELLEREPVEARRHLDLARAMVRSSLGEARRFVWGLRAQTPSARGGLVDALGGVVRQLDAPVGRGPRVALAVRGEPRPLAAAVEDGLFRIGQEAITNAVRHAAASRVEAELAFDDGQVRLAVRDNGRGFEPAGGAAADGFGVRGMRERATALSGVLDVRSAPGEGTEVSVRVAS